MDPRTCATLVLQQVLGKQRSLTSVLPDYFPRLDDPGQQAFTQQLCYGVLRWQPQLEVILNSLMDKALRRKDQDLHCLLLLGLFQILHLQTPDHAAVSETVAVTRRLKKPWARSLVNAVLRNLLRRQQETLKSCDDNPAYQSAHPAWLRERIEQAWPEQAPEILAANNRQAPMWLRLNRNRTSVDEYLKQLEQTGLPASLYAPTGAIRLEQATDVTRLPGFSEGLVSVQDAAAQFTAGILAAEQGHRLLDACSAPGGKTAQILETTTRLDCLALDQDPARLKRVDDTLQRLGLSASTLCADAADTDSWWNGQQFDRILLDAPCSGTGVIRRHPDIKILRREDDIQSLSEQQQRLLRSLWPLLKTGGRLVYATCSIMPEENQHQIAAFVHAHADARHCPPELPVGQALEYGTQILPGEQAMDGFYYACLEKS